MIAPARTASPSPALTPRRWPALSRPFLTLEPAFLWAIGQSFFVVRDVLVVSSAFALVEAVGALAFDSVVSALLDVVDAFFAPPLASLAGALPALLLAPAVLFVSASSSVDFAFAGLSAASLAASAASWAAWRLAASSSRWRSVSRRSSAFATSSAALLPASTMSLIRTTRSSWRWPFFTRRRAFGRYLKLISFSPRSRRRTSADTDAFSTTGRPIEAVSPSAMRRTRSNATDSPGPASRSSISSSVPTSTRYCFPPVSMTAYMEPLGVMAVARRRPRPLGQENGPRMAETRSGIVRPAASERQFGPITGLVIQLDGRRRAQRHASTAPTTLVSPQVT